MLTKLVTVLRRSQFAASTFGVFQTAPISVSPRAGLVVITQLQHRDVGKYLVAAKSFATHIAVEAFHVLSDGSLTEEDCEALRHHVPGCAIEPVSHFTSPHCPSGGTWERLIAIARLVRTAYVIQLDSDTLSLGPLDEVATCVASGTAFTLGTWPNQRVETMSERLADARAQNPTSHSHVQLVAEANLDAISGHAKLSYIRGCSGFAGFPRESFELQAVESISRDMERVLGAKWSAWGSEQFMSNVVVANTARKMVLPYPKYGDCTASFDRKTAHFIHFIGTCRFDGGLYAKLGREFVNRTAGVR